MRRAPAIALVCAAALIGPATAQAAPVPSKQSSFTVRQTLTPFAELRGDVRFTTPAGWMKTAGGGRHSYVTFRVTEGTCAFEVSIGMRGKATKLKARQQVFRDSAAFGHGTRPGGAWGTQGPTFSGGEGNPDVDGLYGIAAIEVADNRFGQLRIFTNLRECDPESAEAKAVLAADARTTKQVNHVLAKAKTSLREVRTSSR